MFYSKIRENMTAILQKKVENSTPDQVPDDERNEVDDILKTSNSNTIFKVLLREMAKTGQQDKQEGTLMSILKHSATDRPSTEVNARQNKISTVKYREILMKKYGKDELALWPEWTDNDILNEKWELSTNGSGTIQSNYNVHGNREPILSISQSHQQKSGKETSLAKNSSAVNNKQMETINSDNLFNDKRTNFKSFIDRLIPLQQYPCYEDVEGILFLPDNLDVYCWIRIQPFLSQYNKSRTIVTSVVETQGNYECINDVDIDEKIDENSLEKTFLNVPKTNEIKFEELLPIQLGLDRTEPDVFSNDYDGIQISISNKDNEDEGKTGSAPEDNEIKDTNSDTSNNDKELEELIRQNKNLIFGESVYRAIYDSFFHLFQMNKKMEKINYEKRIYYKILSLVSIDTTSPLLENNLQANPTNNNAKNEKNKSQSRLSKKKEIRNSIDTSNKSTVSTTSGKDKKKDKSETQELQPKKVDNIQQKSEKKSINIYRYRWLPHDNIFTPLSMTNVPTNTQNNQQSNPSNEKKAPTTAATTGTGPTTAATTQKSVTGEKSKLKTEENLERSQTATTSKEEIVRYIYPPIVYTENVNPNSPVIVNNRHQINMPSTSGKYIVKLYFMGKWRKVYVDDYMPINQSAKHLLPIIIGRNEEETNKLWSFLLTKALLKVLALIYSNVDWSHLPYNTLHLTIIYLLTSYEPELMNLQKKQNFLSILNQFIPFSDQYDDNENDIKKPSPIIAYHQGEIPMNLSKSCRRSEILRSKGLNHRLCQTVSVNRYRKISKENREQSHNPLKLSTPNWKKFRFGIKKYIIPFDDIIENDSENNFEIEISSLFGMEEMLSVDIGKKVDGIAFPMKKIEFQEKNLISQLKYCVESNLRQYEPEQRMNGEQWKLNNAPPLPLHYCLSSVQTQSAIEMENEQKRLELYKKCAKNLMKSAKCNSDDEKLSGINEENNKKSGKFTQRNSDNILRSRTVWLSLSEFLICFNYLVNCWDTQQFAYTTCVDDIIKLSGISTSNLSSNTNAGNAANMATTTQPKKGGGTATTKEKGKSVQNSSVLTDVLKATSMPHFLHNHFLSPENDEGMKLKKQIYNVQIDPTMYNKTSQKIIYGQNRQLIADISRRKWNYSTFVGDIQTYEIFILIDYEYTNRNEERSSNFLHFHLNSLPRWYEWNHQSSNQKTIHLPPQNKIKRKVSLQSTDKKKKKVQQNNPRDSSFKSIDNSDQQYVNNQFHDGRVLNYSFVEIFPYSWKNRNYENKPIYSTTISLINSFSLPFTPGRRILKMKLNIPIAFTLRVNSNKPFLLGNEDFILNALAQKSYHYIYDSLILFNAFQKAVLSYKHSEQRNDIEESINNLTNIFYPLSIHPSPSSSPIPSAKSHGISRGASSTLKLKHDNSYSPAIFQQYKTQQQIFRSMMNENHHLSIHLKRSEAIINFNRALFRFLRDIIEEHSKKQATNTTNELNVKKPANVKNTAAKVEQQVENEIQKSEITNIFPNQAQIERKKLEFAWRSFTFDFASTDPLELFTANERQCSAQSHVETNEVKNETMFNSDSIPQITYSLEEENAAVTVQSAWKGFLVRRMHNSRIPGTIEHGIVLEQLIESLKLIKIAPKKYQNVVKLFSFYLSTSSFSSEMFSHSIFEWNNIFLCNYGGYSEMERQNDSIHQFSFNDGKLSRQSPSINTETIKTTNSKQSKSKQKNNQKILENETSNFQEGNKLIEGKLEKILIIPHLIYRDIYFTYVDSRLDSQHSESVLANTIIERAGDIIEKKSLGAVEKLNRLNGTIRQIYDRMNEDKKKLKVLRIDEQQIYVNYSAKFEADELSYQLHTDLVIVDNDNHQILRKRLGELEPYHFPTNAFGYTILIVAYQTFNGRQLQPINRQKENLSSTLKPNEITKQKSKQPANSSTISQSNLPSATPQIQLDETKLNIKWNLHFFSTSLRTIIPRTFYNEYFFDNFNQRLKDLKSNDTSENESQLLGKLKEILLFSEQEFYKSYSNQSVNSNYQTTNQPTTTTTTISGSGGNTTTNVSAGATSGSSSQSDIWQQKHNEQMGIIGINEQSIFNRILYQTNYFNNLYTRKEFTDYFIPRRANNLIVRYNISTLKDQLSTIYFYASNTMAHIQLSIIDKELNKKIIEVDGFGQATIPAVIFWKSRTDILISNEKIYNNLSETNTNHVERPEKSPVPPAKKGSKNASSKMSKSSMKNKKPSIDEDTSSESEKILNLFPFYMENENELKEIFSPHHYWLEVRVLNKSWNKLSENQLTFIDQQKTIEKEKNKILKEEVKDEKIKQTTSTSRNRSRMTSQQRGNDLKSTEQKTIDETKAHWKLILFSDKSAENDLTIERDNSTNESLVNMKKAWEMSEPGRLQKGLTTASQYTHHKQQYKGDEEKIDNEDDDSDDDIKLVSADDEKNSEENVIDQEMNGDTTPKLPVLLYRPIKEEHYKKNRKNVNYPMTTDEKVGTIAQFKQKKNEMLQYNQILKEIFLKEKETNKSFNISIDQTIREARKSYQLKTDQQQEIISKKLAELQALSESKPATPIAPVAPAVMTKNKEKKASKAK
ncbi:hypothetical protein SNEBB_000835 [Seison nebaliae]|nr:hypothetical protein SNEBB_000835 [Seison nebaliae]